MIKKCLSLILCFMLLASLFPSTALAADVDQNLPINDGMESTVNVTGIQSGSVALTQDRVGGNFAVKVSIGDEPDNDYASFNLTTSELFDVTNYGQVKLWVKPGPGAQWIKFYSNGSLISNTNNDPEGKFKVGTDLVSGQWNQVTLDLTKTSLNITQGKDLTATTNEYSTWYFDEITSVCTKSTALDITNMVNSQTTLNNPLC